MAQMTLIDTEEMMKEVGEEAEVVMEARLAAGQGLDMVGLMTENAVGLEVDREVGHQVLLVPVVEVETKVVS